MNVRSRFDGRVNFVGMICNEKDDSWGSTSAKETYFTEQELYLCDVQGATGRLPK